ncbi:MAG: hypothetical protein JNJ99_08645, partial [Crocinitomicaceae bacterium]|nr:hypothetical protein [Crocinitomicaceae bacterium]
MKNLQKIIDNELNHFERAKYLVTRNTALLLAIILFILGIANSIQGDINMIAMFAGSVVAIIVVWVIKVTKNYKVAAFIAMILAAILNGYNFMVT